MGANDFPLYKFLFRPLLFLLPPESAHNFTFFLLKVAYHLPFGRKILEATFCINDDSLKKKILGIEFKNPVGVAAGLDKNGEWIDELSSIGFGFVEIGTVTPLPQSGNNKPRLFRLKKDLALINRMGFNNKGGRSVAERLRIRMPGIIVGGNIGKNKATSNENALSDYIKSMDLLYGNVDYFVINVSSPNTPGLRQLQEKEPLRRLLKGLKDHMNTKPTYYSLWLKVAPDLRDEQVDEIVQIIQEAGVDGLIATNTTIDRKDLKTNEKIISNIDEGGLSGMPLKDKSTEMIRMFRKKLGAGFPIIGVGGILSPKDAKEKIEAGADLIQLYTGLIYEGPGLVRRINKYLKDTFQK
ncbi:MAG TPA: quinone-dependent dihydroorotate dehydrogenase [Cyclobacteriaceae bacterium]